MNQVHGAATWSVWGVLRHEVSGAVQDFQKKGAVNAVCDVALNAVDFARDAGGVLATGIKTAVNSDGADRLEDGIFIEGPNVPEAGETVTLIFSDGTSMDAHVLASDNLSEQHRARVMIDGAEKPLLVPIVDPATTHSTVPDAKENWFIGDVEADDVPNPEDVQHDSFFHIEREWNETVQEIREKGTIHVIKDAALDTVDILHDTAKSVVNVAKTVASPAVNEIREMGAFGAVKDATGVVKGATAGAVTGATGAVKDATVGVVDRAKSTAICGAASEHAASLFNTIKHEWQGTVQDINEKGAVSTLKDAALDAAEIVGSTASSTVSAARDVVVGPRTQAVLDGVHVLQRQVVVDQASARASGAALKAANVINGARSSASQLLMAAAKMIEVPDDQSNTKDVGGGKFRSRADESNQSEPEPGPEPRITPHNSERALEVADRVKQWKSPGAESSRLPERKVSGIMTAIGSWPVSADKDHEAALAAAKRVPGRRSLVSMRSRMFEKSKLEAGIESKGSNEDGVVSKDSGEEELID